MANFLQLSHGEKTQPNCEIELIKIVKSIGYQENNLLDSIGFGIFIVNAQTHIISYANDAASKIIGQSRESIIGTMCHQYVCPAEIGKCPITDLGQNTDNAERILIKAYGQRIPVIKTVVPILLNGGKYLVESFIGITERRCQMCLTLSWKIPAEKFLRPSLNTT
jgi:PAS domain S-box-containing protein